jgi:hypothetical protein
MLRTDRRREKALVEEVEQLKKALAVWDKLSVSPQGCTSEVYANLGSPGMRWDTQGGGRV